MSKKTRASDFPRDPLKDATLNALSNLLGPLVDLLFDTGITVREFNHVLRETAAVNASKRLVLESGHSSKSRISILTGLPRSEIARILLKSRRSKSSGRQQHPIRRILSAWYDDLAFLGADGEPAVLPIFGKRRSFERLVRKHGGGVPVRAMLDELDRIGAVERLQDQTVRPRTRIPVMTGLTATSISQIGERGRDLLQTMVSNARAKGAPLFEATSVLDDVGPEGLAIGRREILQQGSAFIGGVDGLFEQIRLISGKSNGGGRRGRARIGVTAFYFEEKLASGNVLDTACLAPRRRNLKRG